MIEYIDTINRRFLTSVIKKSNERFQIVTDMLWHIDTKEMGVYEYGNYVLFVDSDLIQIVTPKNIYIKTLSVH